MLSSFTFQQEQEKKRPVKVAYAVFSLGKFGIWATVALSFLFGN